MDTMGLKISIFLASAAALLVGVGLGLQQLFNDIASGIVLLFEGSIKIDDVIELDNNIIGRVILLGIRTSKIKTRDDVVIIVPNSKLVNDNIINWSHMDKKTRFNVKVGVAYGSDVKLVKKLLLKCATTNRNIYEKPMPFVRFLDFGESSLDFQLFFWVKNSFIVENLKSDLRFSINQSFEGNNIQIPFPQRDVHIKSNKIKS
jgi:small-conductance mechanosensitive channel